VSKVNLYIFVFLFQLEAIDGDWEEIIDDLINGFEKQHKRRLAYSIAFY
jgi:RNA polymerase II subunit A C-terminal domain phosphatase SSU72